MMNAGQSMNYSPMAGPQAAGQAGGMGLNAHQFSGRNEVYNNVIPQVYP